MPPPADPSSRNGNLLPLPTPPFCSETSAILAAATPSSLVILDELGRGTSTGDGAAIAEATLHYLVTATRPLVLFITQ